MRRRIRVFRAARLPNGAEILLLPVPRPGDRVGSNPRTLAQRDLSSDEFLEVAVNRHEAMSVSSFVSQSVTTIPINV